MGWNKQRFIYLHPTFWFILVLSMMTGMFYHVLIVFIIVSWHEFGHFFMARFFEWDVRRITLWVFGGVMETEEHLNKPLEQQLLVTIAGPAQHLLILLLLLFLQQTNFLLPEYLDFAFRYNLLIVAFNLLPIWPLDGGKLLNIVFNKFSPFKRSYQSTLIFSFVSIFILIIFMVQWKQALLNGFVLLTFLFGENRLEWKRRIYVYQRFLLARMNRQIDKRKMMPLTFLSQTELKAVFERFYFNRFHPILVRDKQMITSESDCLDYYFNQGQYQATLADLMKQTLK